jgi:hypothetical protein
MPRALVGAEPGPAGRRPRRDQTLPAEQEGLGDQVGPPAERGAEGSEQEGGELEHVVRMAHPDDGRRLAVGILRGSAGRSGTRGCGEPAFTPGAGTPLWGAGPAPPPATELDRHVTERAEEPGTRWPAVEWRRLNRGRQPPRYTLHGVCVASWPSWSRSSFSWANRRIALACRIEAAGCSVTCTRPTWNS